MHILRSLLFSTVCATVIVAADENPLSATMTAGGQAWEYGDTVWFVNDVWEAPGAVSYVWKLRDALLAGMKLLDPKVEVNGFGDARGLPDFVGTTVAPREPAMVVIATGTASAAGKPENAPTADAFGKLLEASLTTLTALHCEVVVLGPSPVSDTPDAKTPANELSAKYAEVAASTARAAGVGYVDMREACLEHLKAHPPVAGKVELTAGDGRYTAAWNELATGLVAKAIGERMAATPMRIDLEDSPFIDRMTVEIPVKRKRTGADLEIRYTTDGREPTATSRKYDKPFVVSGANTTIWVTATDKTNNLTATAKAVFTREKSKPGESISRRALGLEWGLFQGHWQGLPDFTSLKPDATGVWNAPEQVAFHQDPSFGTARENVGLLFVGYIDIPVEGVYTFATISDDGSRMWIDDEQVVENDGGHGMRERHGRIALREGAHRVRVAWYNGTGGSGLEVWWQSDDGIRRARVPDSAWCHNLSKPYDWKLDKKKR